jgi:TetR/AcrR family transcriptional regulator
LYTKFEQLDEAKKDRIINAALKVFSQAKFKNASTDEIVKEAGISKGALFYYFKNKQNLFLYVYEYVIQILQDQLIAHMGIDERDLLIRLKAISIKKVELFKKYPNLFNFIINHSQDELNEISLDLVNKSQELKDHGFQALMFGLDTTLFKEELDQGMVIKSIYWMIEGFANQKLKELEDQPINDDLYHTWIIEFDDYIEMLRKCFYKEEVK